MKIVFAGQLVLTPRIQALASRLVSVGHRVDAFTSEPSIRNLGGVRQRHVPSLMPEAPGGWLYTVLCLVLTVWQRPHLVHIHGWQMAALLPVLTAFLPEATAVWTIDDWPTWPGWITSFIARAGAYLCDAVSVPRRDIQWQLLRETGVRAEYIPDGFDPHQSLLPSIRQFGLWRGRYTAVIAQTPADIAWVKRAYAKVKTRKKLVVVESPSGGRVERAILSGAAAIVIANKDTPCATVLSAMESGRPIVAVAAPLLEETLGITAAFIAPKAEDELTRALGSLKPAPKAQKRARAHFSWDRIFLDYWHLYQPAAFLVPLDSAQGVRITQALVQ